MRGFSSLIAGLTVSVALAIASPAAAENVLRWASVGGALTADPHAYDEGGTTNQLSQVYEVLVGLDSNLEVVPRLAIRWRLVDPTTWEFELRPVRFHDSRYSPPRTSSSALLGPEPSFPQVSPIAPRASPTCKPSTSIPCAS